VSRRPTTAVDRFQNEHIREVVHGVFSQNGILSIDLEALIHLTLKQFNVPPDAYRSMYTRVREVVIKHYAIQQGELIVPHERPHRRLTVCFTLEEQED
jgi:hypothetical protein